jgi:hypothetical protein
MDLADCRIFRVDNEDLVSAFPSLAKRITSMPKNAQCV